MTDSRPGTHPGLDQEFETEDDVFGSRGVTLKNQFGTPVPHKIFGFDVQITPRTTPTIIGALWSPQLQWDGRAGPSFGDPLTQTTVIPSGAALEAQAVLPIVSDHEMGHIGRTWSEVTSKLQNSIPLALATYLPLDMAVAITQNPTYPDLFDDAFGTSAITPGRIAFAIATYERTLIADQTPFDLGTLTPLQQEGLVTFSGCAECHAPPVFSDHSFRNIGVRPIDEDAGRLDITGVPSDAGRFKVPSLRGVGLKSSFMHNGRRGTLEQVVDFYTQENGEVQFPENQEPIIQKFVALPPERRPALMAFLQGGLDDPRMASETFPFDRPVLNSERGDGDRDGDVDPDDRDHFGACFIGSNAGSVAVECQRFDMEGDGDIDCDDWAQFRAAWTHSVAPHELGVCVSSSRFINMVAPRVELDFTAIRVRLINLHHVIPPYTGGPSVPFTSFEGQTRWVGPPIQYMESNSGGPAFYASRLQRTPHYQDWSTVGLLHVTGSAIVPSSVYEVENVAASCMDVEADCTAVSAPLTVSTARWADVETPYNPPSATVQPDLADVSALVNKFRNAPGAPIKGRALLVGGDVFGEIDIATEFSFIHIAACVDAFRGRPYPHQIAECP